MDVRPPMTIFDAQVHANKIAVGWPNADRDTAIDAAIVAMGVVGVDAILMDEWTGYDD